MRNLIFGFALMGTFAAEAQNKPNIILLMADDLGWGDTGYNGNPIIKTPNLDKMASQGIRFNRFYAASSVCSPTRASVLTGRNPNRMGVFNANVGILRPEEITLPELLKEEGYSTGHFGKWHLGTLTQTEKDANRGKPGNTKEYNPPSLHGYDAAFVTESKVPTWDPMKKPVGRSKQAGWDYIKDGEPYEPFGTHYWDINGNKVTENLDGDDSRVIMDRAIPFIEKSISDKSPFFAVVWFHAPHMPCVAGPKYQAMYKGQDALMQNYAGCITAMDEQIGRLRAFLKEKGVDSNTMIWFCSDNGPENGNPGTTGGFRDRKRSLHEGGVRVPGLLVWPEKITKPMVTDIPCVTSDYLPTIIDLLKVDTKKLKYRLDGQSLLPLIELKKFDRKNPIGFAYQNQIALNDSIFKMYAKSGKYELYNIINDPSEANDISSQNSKVLQKMKSHFENFYGDMEASFVGKEYGTLSFDRMKQVWKGMFENNKGVAE